MKRPQRWIHWLILICFFLTTAEYAALTWFVPRHVVRAIQDMLGGELAISDVRFAVPLTTQHLGLRLASNSPEAALSIQRVIVRPRWISLPRRTVWIRSLEIERPLLRVTRPHDGAVRWPHTLPAAKGAPAGRSVVRLPGFLAEMSGWHIHIDSVKVVDGILEFIDQTPSTPFHGLVDHVAFDAGPASIPFSGSLMSFAAQAELVSDRAHAAPVYCSGWFDLASKDLQLSWDLEPLPLFAFEPYFHGRLEVRVYDATLRSTSQWVSKANALQARVQIQVEHLNEGDISVHGRAIIDMKQLAKGEEPRLKGEITLQGSLDDPSRWHADFIPDNGLLQRLMERLMERSIKALKIYPLGLRLALNLMPPGAVVAREAETADKEIQEAIEIMAGPAPEAAPAPVPAPPVPAPPESAPAATAPPASVAPTAPPQAPALPPPTSPEAPQAPQTSQPEKPVAPAPSDVPAQPPPPPSPQ